jgi:pyruvate kinase
VYRKTCPEVNENSQKPEIRRTKIVATIGPACDTDEMMMAMINAGMNVARLNLSHGDLDGHAERIDRLRDASRQLGVQIAIMIDTRGIEIRTGKLEDGSADLAPGDSFSLYMEDRPGNRDGVSVTYRKLAEEVSTGTPILLDDGAIELVVRCVEESVIHCDVVHGGRLGDSKSVNLPETRLALSAVSPENREDVVRELNFAATNDVDYIAASFIQSADDIHRMREILAEKNADIPIIAKIENRAGVDNIDEIVETANGIMVARGDLGVELPLADVPSTQKNIIRKTVTRGKPVITATQMLASMEHNPKPTRAEASDVANAILDGSSAVMLSGETAVGKYPVQAVMTMSTVAVRAEASLSEYGYLQRVQAQELDKVTEAVGQAAVSMAATLKAGAIFCLTETGFTARLVSKYRPECPILAITASVPVARRLAMNWGVMPILFEGERTDEAKIAFAVERAGALGLLKEGDIAIATAGQLQRAGGTDMIRVIIA